MNFLFTDCMSTIPILSVNSGKILNCIVLHRKLGTHQAQEYDILIEGWWDGCLETPDAHDLTNDRLELPS